MAHARRGLMLWLTALLIGVLGLVLTIGGTWLVALGGSWYYVVAGVACLLTAVLLVMRRSAALWLYALVVAGSLVWAYWEAGLDWWPLATRGGLVFVLGVLLLLPWTTRALVPDGRVAALRGGGLALSLALLVSLGVAGAALLNDPHSRNGSFAGSAAEASPAIGAPDIPPGEWHAYGRTSFGQRYSPLSEITPENVDQLTVAWTYRTGDMRGQPGDPVETTFQVTPLKIDDRLYLCTPHQHVIALDATTGAEIWRYNPGILGDLALQHLTCRGLAWHPGTSDEAAGEGGAALPAAPDQAADEVPNEADNEGEGESAPAAPNVRRGPLEDLPIAAEEAERTTECGARLFMPTADGRLVALDPETGAVCESFGGGAGQIDLWANMPNVRPGGYYSTSPPAIVGDVVVVGGTVLDNVSTSEQSGVIRGYDVMTGGLLWNWDSGNPGATEPIPVGETYTANSPNAWSILSGDEALGLVYVPLGNQPPDQWGGNRSESVERFSSSVVALDSETGQLAWVFQTVHHDIWDYDVPSQPTLVDLAIDGETVPALVQPTKQGELYVLDRRSGEPILPVEEVAVPQGAAEGDWTAPTQPVSALSFDPPAVRESDMWGATLVDQLICRIQFRQLRYEGRYTPPSVQGSLVHPGNFGVFNWGGIAVDPVRQIAFSTPAYLGFVSRLIPREDDTSLYVQGDDRPEGSLPALNENFGAPFAVQLYPFTSPLGLPCQEPPWGYVAGADLTTGEIVWMHKNGTVRDQAPVPLPFEMGVPDLGGPVMTAGGVAFISGTIDYFVRGYDVSTGEQLWEDRLPAGGQATPMTYLDADGRQILLVIAGGHGSLGTKAGDHVIAYALPR